MRTSINYQTRGQGLPHPIQYTHTHTHTHTPHIHPPHTHTHTHHLPKLRPFTLGWFCWQYVNSNELHDSSQAYSLVLTECSNTITFKNSESSWKNKIQKESQQVEFCQNFDEAFKHVSWLYYVIQSNFLNPKLSATYVYNLKLLAT